MVVVYLKAPAASQPGKLYSRCTQSYYLDHSPVIPIDEQGGDDIPVCLGTFNSQNHPSFQP